jgi:hypothetical protein
MPKGLLGVHFHMLLINIKCDVLMIWIGHEVDDGHGLDCDLGKNKK